MNKIFIEKWLFKISLLLTLTIVTVASFVSCFNTNLKYGHKYFLYIFDDSAQEFKKTDLNMIFQDSKRFEETYESGNWAKIYGNYNYDKLNEVIYLSYDASIVNDNIRKLQESMLKESDPIKKMALKSILDTLKKNYHEITKYEKYLIKNEHITAIRIQKDQESLTTIEGYYVIPGVNSGSGTSNLALFQKNKVYTKNPSNEEVYDKLMGTYEIQGNYLELQFLEGDVKKGTPQKYLFAEISFKISILEDYSVAEIEKFAPLKENVKVGILAKAFYA